MSVICALKSDDGVWIGADSRVTSNGNIAPVEYQKWRRTAEGIWWGISGHLRLSSIVGDLPGVKTVGDFAAAIRNAVKYDGWSADDGKHGLPPDFCFDVIAVVDGEVYEIGGGGSVIYYGWSFCAQGSGYEYAYGAAFALDEIEPEVIIRTAIEAACRYDSGCGEPIFMELVK